MNLLEARIRDHLSTHLDLIEPNLQLVDHEYALNGDLGCNGSVDIIARDFFGNAVIIEIKRSDQTARTALHELTKYAALIRTAIGIPIERIRLILVSTDWRELAVPFAEFRKFCGLPLDGRVIEVLEDGTVTSARPFVPPPIGLPLSVSKVQDLTFFVSPSDRDASLSTIITAAEQIEIEDFYVLRLDHHGDVDDGINFPHALCFAFSLPPQANDPATMRRIKTLSGWEEEEDDPNQLYGMAYSAAYRTLSQYTVEDQSRDHEVGYPEKLRGMRDTWTTSVAYRNGRYAASAKLYSDTQLIEDAMFMEGGTENYLERIVSPRFGPAWNKLLLDVKTVLAGNSKWSLLVPALLAETAEVYPEATVSIVLNHRKNAFYGLSYLSKYGFGGYMPLLEWLVLTPDETLHYVGELKWNGNVYTGSPYRWLLRHFGDADYFRMVQVWGSALDEDQDVRRSLGILSTVRETVLTAEGERAVRTITLRQKRHIRLYRLRPRYRSLESFCKRHRRFMHSLIERVGTLLTVDMSTGTARRKL